MDFLILRPLSPKTGYHFFEGGVGVGVGGGQKFLLNRLQAVGTHGACNTASGPMVTQPTPDLQASVRILVCRILAPPPAAAPMWPDWGSNRRHRGWRSSALPLGHCLDYGNGPPCCLGTHLPLTKNPNCVYLSDCLLAGSGTDWLTVNLSSRCTAEGNRILSTLHPSTILKPNPDPNTHPNPQPSPNQDRILGPSWWGREH